MYRVFRSVMGTFEKTSAGNDPRPYKKERAAQPRALTHASQAALTPDNCVGRDLRAELRSTRENVLRSIMRKEAGRIPSGLTYNGFCTDEYGIKEK